MLQNRPMHLSCRGRFCMIRLLIIFFELVSLLISSWFA